MCLTLFFLSSSPVILQKQFLLSFVGRFLSTSVVARRHYHVCVVYNKDMKLLMMIVMLGSCDFRMAYASRTYNVRDIKVVSGQEKDADN